jgi:hypothetical protein
MFQLKFRVHFPYFHAHYMSLIRSFLRRSGDNSIVRLIGCRSTTGVCTVLKVMHESDLTCLSCCITTKGASYRSCILKWWPPNIQKKKIFDKIIGHKEDGGLNLLCGGTIGLQGRQRNVSICTVKWLWEIQMCWGHYTRNWC